ncbi:M24 family metallopeptidase [Halomonas elongata]|uniref:Peptidase M24 family protein n=1 Tax=Halomonas elongata (strain ATCC 33173 / DSM 2581 / NBRC 15536 / NCIMB 2198 / 1H9) TaxID=768066 RepID=E1V7X4_HALED|nr:Xaa-Pro peptidase family protein [Halomonas elongata]WBF18776.1 Xaa-Pro peptidase family protein [Halomonas elongata]WPU47632.1 Xaa-Pro peptidase family protein [Halomonas elongata DSM 2581]CBV41537.1 peptidase M24 family protein [Halomonas elongata DSM 2581]
MDYQAYRQALAATQQGSELTFMPQEFTARRREVRRRMRQMGIDALLLTDPADLYYLTGYHSFEVSVHACLVVTAERLVLQVPSIETGPAVVTAMVDEILGYRWESIDEVVEPLAETLAPHGVIGLDAFNAGLRHGVIGELQARLGAARFRNDGGELLDGVRIVKSAAELECLRESARITSLGLGAAEAIIEPGVTDNQVAAEGARAMLAAGSEFMSLQPIVTSGHRSGTIHVNHKRRTIEQDEPVFLEFGAAFQRYTAPMMRTVVAGQPSRDMLALGELCREIGETLCTAMRPGNTFDEAARAAEAVLASQSERAFFSGVFGYAVGAQFPPSWVEGTGFIARGQVRAFESDMVFHLPLCLRLPGEWGIGLSDTVRVTPEGGVALTDNDWRLATPDNAS